MHYSKWRQILFVDSGSELNAFLNKNYSLNFFLKIGFTGKSFTPWNDINLRENIALVNLGDQNKCFQNSKAYLKWETVKKRGDETTRDLRYDVRYQHEKSKSAKLMLNRVYKILSRGEIWRYIGNNLLPINNSLCLSQIKQS